MSSFMGTAGNGTSGINTAFEIDDGRLRPEWFDDDEYRWITVDCRWAMDGFRNWWWPGGNSVATSGNEWCQAVWYDRMEINSGQRSNFGFMGVTRDVYGTAVPGASVSLYLTSTGALIYQTVSDAGGNFTLFTTFWPDPHFIVAQKAGSPNIVGASVNTLIAA